MKQLNTVFSEYKLLVGALARTLHWGGEIRNQWEKKHDKTGNKISEKLGDQRRQLG
jgi:hypothetical protein